MSDPLVGEAGRVLAAVEFWADPLNPRRKVPLWAYDAMCECPPEGCHWIDCSATPMYHQTWMAGCDIPNFWDVRSTPSFAHTWSCAVHGLLGDINGPLHYQACPHPFHAPH